MSITINGSTGISGVDGSTGTPALQGSDSNTGIRFGSDIVSLVTGGSDRLYIDSSGRLGIGNSSPGTNTSNNANSLVIGDNSSATERGLTIGSTTGGGIRFNDGADAGVVEYSHASNFMRFVVNTSTEAARFDSSGRLLVGTTTTSAAPLTVNGTIEANGSLYRAVFGNGYVDGDSGVVSGGNSAEVQIQTVTSNRPAILSLGGAQAAYENLGSISFFNSGNTDGKRCRAQIVCGQEGGTANEQGGVFLFLTAQNTGTSPTERWRIDSSGSLVGVAGSAFVAPYVYNTTTATAANVNVDATGFLRRSTSSIKYKTNVETIEDQYADAILGCRPVWYQSTCEADNPTWGYWGFIAEEVAAIDPRLCFFKEEEDGTFEPEGVQYDRFVPHLLNLIKRQAKAIADLQVEVAALKAQ